MEAGNRSISTLELAQLAELYERPIVDFFFEGPLSEAPEDDPILALHRITNSFKDHPGVHRQVGRCVEICREGADLERMNRRTPRPRRNSKDRSETRANTFAAALLMPEGGVRSCLASLDKGLPSRQTRLVYDLADDGGVEASGRSAPGSQTIGYQDVVSLARYFGVSYQAAAFRLQALSIVNQSERESLNEQEEFGNRYLRMLKFQQAIASTEADKDQKDSQEKELVSQVAYLAIEAFRREEISKGRLLELSKKLQIDGKELLALAQGAL